MTKTRAVLLAGILSASLASTAQSAPIVSVDTNPGLAGVQSSSVLNVLGGSLDIDIVIEGVDPMQPLNGFEFDLFFDPAILTATSVVDGGFLLSPVFEVQNNIGVMSVEFAEVTLGAGGASGSGVLATISFDAISAGDSLLDLDDVVLSAPFGQQIAVQAVNDGRVTVTPEPTGMALFATGLLLAVAGIRRR